LAPFCPVEHATCGVRTVSLSCEASPRVLVGQAEIARPRRLLLSGDEGAQADAADETFALLGAELDVSYPQAHRRTRDSELALDLLYGPAQFPQAARLAAFDCFHNRQRTDAGGRCSHEPTS